MAQMDVDACPSAIHGSMALATSRTMEATLDALAREVVEEVKAKSIRLQSRLAVCQRDPNHVTVFHVTVQVIDQDATADAYRRMAEKTGARMVRLFEFAAYHFERVRRVLRSVDN